MPFFQLHIDLECEGLSLVGFKPSTTDPQLECAIRCSSCHEMGKAVVSLSDEHESEDGKAKLHYAANCKSCKAAVKIWISQLKPLVKDKVIKAAQPLPYITDYYCQIGTPINNGDDDGDAQNKVIKPNTLFAVLEARGCEVTGFSVINTEFHATNDGKSFYAIGDLSSDGYYDVNEDNESISVTLTKYRVQ